jgi:hypothetical protein
LIGCSRIVVIQLQSAIYHCKLAGITTPALKSAVGEVYTQLCVQKTGKTAQNRKKYCGFHVFKGSNKDTMHLYLPHYLAALAYTFFSSFFKHL